MENENNAVTSQVNIIKICIQVLKDAGKEDTDINMLS